MSKQNDKTEINSLTVGDILAQLDVSVAQTPSQSDTIDTDDGLVESEPLENQLSSAPEKRFINFATFLSSDASDIDEAEDTFDEALEDADDNAEDDDIIEDDESITCPEPDTDSEATDETDDVEVEDPVESGTAEDISATSSTEQSPRTRSVLSAKWAAFAAAVIVICCVAILSFSSLPIGPWEDANAQVGHPASRSEEDIQEDLKVETSERCIVVNVAPYAVVEPGSTHCVGADFENVENNICDQKFSLKIRNTGETLYESGAVAPGEYISDIELKRPLKRGTYNCVVVIQGYTQDAGFAGLHQKIGPPIGLNVVLIVSSDQAEIEKIAGTIA